MSEYLTNVPFHSAKETRTDYSKYIYTQASLLKVLTMATGFDYFRFVSHVSHVSGVLTSRRFRFVVPCVLVRAERHNTT